MGYLTKVENRGNVKYVIGDMYEPYLLVTKAMFKNAKYVVDRFHYVRYIMDAIDGIRKRLQKKFVKPRSYTKPLPCRKFAFVFNEKKVIRQLSINTLRKDFHL